MNSTSAIIWNLCKKRGFSFSILALIIACTGCVGGHHRLRNAVGADEWPIAKKLACGATIRYLEFDDHGFMWDPNQLYVILNDLEPMKSRKSPSASRHPKAASTDQDKEADIAPTVVMFVHGWKHSAQDEDGNHKIDGNIKDFKRDILEPLCENGVENVHGIYVGWTGKSTSVPMLKEFNFYARYATVSRIGQGPDFGFALRMIARATKRAHDNGKSGRFIVGGHSMGSMLLQEAVSAMLPAISETPKFIAGKLEPRGTDVDTKQGFPDMFLFLNSAAHSLQTMKIVTQLSRQPITAKACVKPQEEECGESKKIDVPVFISISSTEDGATPLLKYGRVLEIYPGSRRTKRNTQEEPFNSPSEPFEFDQKYYWKSTEGNNRELITHRLSQCTNPPIDGRSFDSLSLKNDGQWLCLNRQQESRMPPDVRFAIITVDKNISAAHSDIFNDAALCLYRAVASLRLGELSSTQFDCSLGK